MGYYVGITMDISERKQAEQEREKLRQLEANLGHIAGGEKENAIPSGNADKSSLIRRLMA